jgi:outer membrane protein TolC
MSAGTGAAYTSGYPTSIDGNPPAIVQGRLGMALFNRPQSYLVAQSREGVRSAAIETARRQNEVVYQVASFYYDAERAARGLETVDRESANLARVRELIDQRVAEGRDLPIESKKAVLAVLRAKQRVEALSIDLANAENSLTLLLGLAPGDRASVRTEQREPLMIPESEDTSVETAVAGSQEVKLLESSMQGKLLEIKSYQAARLPKINFLTQYAMLAKRNYADYFTRFQRNNEEVGASIEIPLIVGRGVSAQMETAGLEVAKLKVEMARTRSRIAGDVRRAYQDLKRAESARQLARADLDVAREELNVFLAQMDEGRLPVARVEAARAAENEKWLAYYDSEHAAEIGKLSVLRQLGTLEAALR